MLPLSLYGHVFVLNTNDTKYGLFIFVSDLSCSNCQISRRPKYLQLFLFHRATRCSRELKDEQLDKFLPSSETYDTTTPLAWLHPTAARLDPLGCFVIVCICATVWKTGVNGTKFMEVSGAVSRMPLKLRLSASFPNIGGICFLKKEKKKKIPVLFFLAHPLHSSHHNTQNAQLLSKARRQRLGVPRLERESHREAEFIGRLIW